MPYAFDTYSGTGSQTDFNISFPYINEDHVKVYVNYVNTAFTFEPNKSTARLASAPASGVAVEVRRITPLSSVLVDYADGSTLTAGDLDTNNLQHLYIEQELDDIQNKAVSLSPTTGLPTANNKRITEVADPTNAQDAVTKAYLERTGSITTTQILNGTIINEDIANTTIQGGKLVPDTITAAQIGPDAVTASELANNSVDTNAIVNLNVTRAKLENDVIDGTKIENDAVDSEHIAADSLDTEHYAQGSIDATALGTDSVIRVKIQNDAVNGDKIDANSIDSEHYVNGSIDVEHLADNSVDRASILNDAVNGDKIDNNSIDSDHYVDGSIDVEHLADNSVDRASILNDAVNGDKIDNNSIDSDHYVDGSIDRIHLEADIIDGTKLEDNAVNNEHIATDAVRTDEIQDGSITSAKLNAATVVTAAEQAAASVNDTSFFTTSAAEARFFNASTGETIKDGQTFPDNDTTIATTAAINDRILELVDQVGGFVPLASEATFPAANPDAEDGPGTIVSVGVLGATYTPSSGTCTIPDSTLTNISGSNVTITDCGTTVLAAGFGVLVETTSTLHTYKFHRLVPKATEVTTVAANATQVQTVHTNISAIQAVAADASDIGAVAADAADIGAVAAKATEIGRLGTADAVADLALLGTADVVADMNLLATSDVIADMNLLATSDVIADLALLGTSDAVSDMNSLATSGNITAMSNCSTNISSITNASNNISSVNNFGDKYQIASSAPSTDGGGNALAEGDLYFDTSSDELKVYNGGSWQGGVTASGNFATTTGNTFTGHNTYSNDIKAKFGADTDLEIWHSNSDATNYISSDLGDLSIKTVEAEKDITLESADDVHIKSGSAFMAKFIGGGSSQLLHNNNLKLATTSTGVEFGTGNDILIINAQTLYRNGSNGSGLHFTNAAIYPTDNSGTLNNGAMSLGTSSYKFNVVHASNFNGSGANLTNLNAGNISSGTVAAGRLGSGTPSSSNYLRGDGSWQAIDLSTKLNISGGQITGNITCSGSQTFDGRDLSTDGSKLDGIESGATADQTASEILTLIKTVDGSGSGLDADTLDGVTSGSFLRSDADDTSTGNLTLSSSSDQKLILAGSASPYIRWREGSTDKAYIQWSTYGYLQLGNSEDSSSLLLRDNLSFSPDNSNWYTVWHGGNDGSGSLLDADKLDGVEGASYLRSDTNDTFTGSTLTFNSAEPEKIILQGATDPYIRFQEGTTNKAYLQWHSDGHIYLWNIEQGRGLRLGSQPQFYDGNYRQIWHSGNDGAGSGLEADLLDGVQGSSYLRSDADDSTSGIFTIQGHDFKNHNNYNFIIQANGNSAAGLCHEDANGNFMYQIYGSGGSYGFLDGKWANWDIRKALGGQLEIDVGGTLYTVWHGGNDGAGSTLDADFLDGQQGSYYSNYNNLSNKPTIPTNNNQLSNGAGYVTSAGATAATGLSDYAVGNWSPSYYNFNVGSITTNYARYVKVGNLVHFTCKFSIGSGTADSDIIGFTLPYTNGSYDTVVSGHNTANNLSLSPCGYLTSGSSYCWVRTAGRNISLVYNSFGGQPFTISGTYYV